MIKQKVDNSISDATEKLFEELSTPSARKKVQQEVTKAANRLRINPATETIEISFVIELKKVKK